MGKEYTLGELAGIMGQADVLKIRITAAKSQLGHKENTIKENNQRISQNEGLKTANISLSGEIESGRKAIEEDESKLKELFDILAKNGIPVSETLRGTNIISI